MYDTTTTTTVALLLILFLEFVKNVLSAKVYTKWDGVWHVRMRAVCSWAWVVFMRSITDVHKEVAVHPSPRLQNVMHSLWLQYYCIVGFINLVRCTAQYNSRTRSRNGYAARQPPVLSVCLAAVERRSPPVCLSAADHRRFGTPTAP